MRVMNGQILLAAMIESGRGIDNVEAVAAVPGIDVLHVGSNDLLVEMGIPEQMGRDRHFALCDRVVKACRAHGKFCGVGGARTLEVQARLIEMGICMLTTNSDLAFLIAAAGERARRLRQVALLPTRVSGPKEPRPARAARSGRLARRRNHEG
jgi:staphyloferrin B biosynthesis citrate synthase